MPQPKYLGVKQYASIAKAAVKEMHHQTYQYKELSRRISVKEYINKL